MYLFKVYLSLKLITIYLSMFAVKILLLVYSDLNAKQVGKCTHAGQSVPTPLSGKNIQVLAMQWKQDKSWLLVELLSEGDLKSQ